MLNETHQLPLGCSGLAGLYQPVSDTDVEEVLNAAWDSGTRYFDTAPHYGNGASDQRLGQCLRDRTCRTLSTKVGLITFVTTTTSWTKSGTLTTLNNCRRLVVFE